MRVTPRWERRRRHRRNKIDVLDVYRLELGTNVAGYSTVGIAAYRLWGTHDGVRTLRCPTLGAACISLQILYVTGNTMIGTAMQRTGRTRARSSATTRGSSRARRSHLPQEDEVERERRSADRGAQRSVPGRRGDGARVVAGELLLNERPGVDEVEVIPGSSTAGRTRWGSCDREVKLPVA